MIELEEFLNFIGEEKNFRKVEPMKELVSMWRDRYPSAKVDDILFMMEKYKKKIEEKRREGKTVEQKKINYSGNFC